MDARLVLLFLTLFAGSLACDTSICPQSASYIGIDLGIEACASLQPKLPSISFNPLSAGQQANACTNLFTATLSSGPTFGSVASQGSNNFCYSGQYNSGTGQCTGGDAQMVFDVAYGSCAQVQVTYSVRCTGRLPAYHRC